MAAIKKVQDIFDGEEIIVSDGLTVTAAQKAKKYNGPMVDVFLPRLEEEGGGVKVDQYEHVTIANEEGEQIWHVQRGMHVEVPVPVFIQLKQGRYPDL